MAKTPKSEGKVIERTYNVPLRKEFQKVPRHKKTNKAVKAMKQFLSKHMKSDNVRLGASVNQELWKHGIKNPPHHVKVSVKKDAEGVVTAELFGAKKETKKESKKPVKKEAAPKQEQEKVETPQAPEKATPVLKEEKKTEETSKEQSGSPE